MAPSASVPPGRNPYGPAPTARPTSPPAQAPAPAYHIPGSAGVGITFEPDMQYGSKTHGMHIITKIRPNSPAHKSCRVQVGDILSTIKNAGEQYATPVSGVPISRVLSLLTGQPGTAVQLQILDGKFPYLQPKVLVVQREMVPTGITHTEASRPMGSARPMEQLTMVPVSAGSIMPMRSAAPMYRSPAPVYAAHAAPVMNY